MKKLPKTKKEVREYEARCAFVRSFVEAGRTPPAGYEDVLEDVLIAIGREKTATPETQAEPDFAWDDLVSLKMSKDAAVNRSVLPEVAEALEFVRGYFPGAYVTDVRVPQDQASALQSALDAGGQ